MIVQCKKCWVFFEDVYRSTVCPHDAFPSNDGNNNFTVHTNAYLSQEPPGNPHYTGMWDWDDED